MTSIQVRIDELRGSAGSAKEQPCSLASSALSVGMLALAAEVRWVAWYGMSPHFAASANTAAGNL